MDQGLLCDLKGIVGSAEVAPAAVYMRLHQEGSVHVQETEDTPESDTISESRKSHFRKDRLRITSEYDT